MADEKNNTRRSSFDGMYFWGMVSAMFASLGIFVVLALTTQVHMGHG